MAGVALPTSASCHGLTMASMLLRLHAGSLFVWQRSGLDPRVEPEDDGVVRMGRDEVSCAGR